MTKTTNPARDELREAYLYVVNNWAVVAEEVAGKIKTLRTKQDATKVLRKLSRAGLIVGEHVNGEKELTWQSYYDIENSNVRETRAAARADFDAAFPKVAAPAPATRAGATGPRYTEKQITDAVKMRGDGYSWKAIAKHVGVKSPAYFAKVIQAEIKSRTKAANKAVSGGRKSSSAAKKSSARKTSARRLRVGGDGPEALKELFRM